MDAAALWQGIAEAALNYIVVSTISSGNQKQTVTDLKTDLRTTKEDILAEVKSSKQAVLAKVETDTKAETEIFKTHFESQKEQTKGN
ncbi:MAG: hypothetical protein MJZ52_07010 [Bacteroidales bacterium]|nr:hypothetical protein [Bacteroidales bacterium]